MQVHGVDDQRDIGRIFANYFRESLMRQTGVERRYFGPALEPRTGEITLDASYAGFADLRDFREQSGRDSGDALSASISTASLRERIVGSSVIAAILLLIIGVPTGRPDNDCSMAEIRPVMLPTPRSGFPIGTETWLVPAIPDEVLGRATLPSTRRCSLVAGL
jgi:hypothetical protein